MPEFSGPVRETRRPPFCFQTLDATAAIRARFDGVRRGTAIAIYATLTEVANEEGGASARESFEATRKRIAEMVGISVDTLDRYVRILEQIGLIAVERRTEGGAHLPNVWHLSDPPGRTDAARVAAPVRHIRARTLPEEERKPKKDPSGAPTRARSTQQYSQHLEATREPFAKPAVTAFTLAQALVAHFVDESTRLHSPPPRRVTGQIAARVGEMVGEGIDPRRIRAGIDLLLARGLNPQSLPSAVHEAGLPPPKPRVDRGRSAAEMLAAADRLEGR